MKLFLTILTTFFFVFIMTILFLAEAQSNDICTDQFEKCLKACPKKDPENKCLLKCTGEAARCDSEERKKHPTPSVIDEIQARCAKKWPDDYEMQLYCTDTQVKAYIRIFEIKHGLEK